MRVLFVLISIFSFGLNAQEKWECPKGDVLSLPSSPETLPERIVVDSWTGERYFYYLSMDSEHATHWSSAGNDALIIFMKKADAFKFTVAPAWARFCKKVN